MSSSTCFQHSPIVDQTTATIVCVDCSRVLDQGLTHFEVNQQKYSTLQENLKDGKEKINPEKVYKKVIEILN